MFRYTGVDVADIQDLYGHVDPRTTKIYAPPWLPRHLEAISRLRVGAHAASGGPGEPG